MKIKGIIKKLVWVLFAILVSVVMVGGLIFYRHVQEGYFVESEEYINLAEELFTEAGVQDDRVIFALTMEAGMIAERQAQVAKVLHAILYILFFPFLGGLIAICVMLFWLTKKIQYHMEPDVWDNTQL